MNPSFYGWKAPSSWAVIRLMPLIVVSVCISAEQPLVEIPATSPGSQAVRVLVWDEQQPEQKQAYGGFLGEAIAKYLSSRPGFVVRSAKWSDPEQGLSESLLDRADVLVYWSHFRSNPAIKEEAARRVVDRIKAGKLALIALHSAHWSEPFVLAMRERTIEDALKTLSPEERKNVKMTFVTPKRFVAPRRTSALTPSLKKEVGPDGTVTLEITFPNCCFPAYRADAKPSHVTTLLPDHPIASGIPQTWDIPQTEMYDEPFHVPEPDQVIFEEKWEGGEHFRSGMVWNVGAGKVFYFRPGHEIYPIYKQELPLKVIANACAWLSRSGPLPVTTDKQPDPDGTTEGTDAKSATK
jgi:trehalose utilization protein